MAGEAPRTDRLIGQVLAERYQVLERLGEGAMGVVFKARHVKVGRTFAVKVVHPHLIDDGKTAMRFSREAELGGRLRHPNVIGVVDVGELDGLRYMVMDLAEGPDLAHVLAEAPLPRERIIHLVRQILEGLYHAHEQGLIHRDLKPENVIVERDSHGLEVPRIVDFGIAILRDDDAPAESTARLTTNGLVLGTPHYMAPEQAVADPIDHRIDLFALGIVIYEMLCGRLPFDGSGADIARANLLLDPPPISQRVKHLEVDPLLEAFARRLMAKKPGGRPATAKAARELLDLIERDRPAAAAALGVPPTVSLRIPAATQPVEPQQSLPIWAPAPPTTRLKTRPASSDPLPGAVTPAATAVLLVPAAVLPSRSPAHNAATVLPSPSLALALVAHPQHAAQLMASMTMPPPMRPGPASIQPTLEVLPLATASAVPGMSQAPNTPLLQRDLQTAIRTPLDWVGLKRPARTRWRIAAVAVALTAAIAVVVWRGSGSKPVAPAVAAVDQAAPSKTGATPGPPPTATAASSEPATAPTGSSESPTATAAPGSTELAPAPSAPSRRSHNRSGAHAIRTAEPAPSAAAVDAPSGSAARAPVAAEPTPATPRPADPAPVAPAPAAPARGVTPSAVATMYYAVPKALDALPNDESADLRERLRRYNVQALMLAPQAERDAAADQLSQILREAGRRKSDGKSPRRSAP